MHHVLISKTLITGSQPSLIPWNCFLLLFRCLCEIEFLPHFLKLPTYPISSLLEVQNSRILSSILGSQSVQREILTNQNVYFLTGQLHIQVQYTPDMGHAFIMNSPLPLKKWLQIVMSVDDTTIYVTIRHFNGHVFEKQETAVHRE